MHSQTGLQLPAQADHRVGVVEFQRARIVAVAQISIRGIEAHVARSHARGGANGLIEFGFGLRKHIACFNHVGFVATLFAGDAQHLRGTGSDEVLKASALVGLLFFRGAHHQIDRAELEGQAGVQAPVFAVEVHHPAAAFDGGLRAHRNGLPLCHAARTAVHRDRAFAQRGGLIKAVLPARTDLALAGGFAHLELLGHRSGLARVGIDLRARQAQRVVRHLGDVAGQHRDAVLRVVPTHAQIAQGALCLRVRAKAVNLKFRDLRLDVERFTQRRLHTQAKLLQAEASTVDIDVEARLVGCAAEQGDHTA